MQIEIHSENRLARVKLAGNIDEKGAEDLKRRFLDLDMDVVKDVVFDFSGVTFIGSSGIGKLLLLYKSVAAKSGKITIENMSKDIYTMFKVVKLDKIFDISSL